MFCYRHGVDHERPRRVNAASFREAPLYDELQQGCEAGAPAPSEPATDRLFVGSLDKALRVLEAFENDRRDLGITEIAVATGMTKSAAQRFVHSLNRLGLLQRDPETRRYSPGRRLLDLGFLYLRHDSLAELAAPFLIDASERCGERVNLSEFDGHDIVYVFRVPTRMMAYVNSVVGRRLPAFCTSGGRVALAALPEAEARRIVETSDRQPFTPQTLTEVEAVMERIAEARWLGYAFSAGEILIGELAVAAPVLDNRGRPAGAVHISVSANQWSEERVRRELAPLAMETARAISRPRGARPSGGAAKPRPQPYSAS